MFYGGETRQGITMVQREASSHISIELIIKLQKTKKNSLFKLLTHLNTESKHQGDVGGPKIERSGGYLPSLSMQRSGCPHQKTGHWSQVPLEISHNITLFVLTTRSSRHNHLPLSTLRNVTLHRDEIFARNGRSRVPLTLFNPVDFATHHNLIVMGAHKHNHLCVNSPFFF